MDSSTGGDGSGESKRDSLDEQKISKVLEIFPQLNRTSAAKIIRDNPGLHNLDELIAKAVEAMNKMLREEADREMAMVRARIMAEESARAMARAKEEERRQLQDRLKAGKEFQSPVDQMNGGGASTRGATTTAAATATAPSSSSPVPAPSTFGLSITSEPFSSFASFRVFSHKIDRSFVAEDSTTLHVRNAECIYLRMLNKYGNLTPRGTFTQDMDIKNIESIDYVWNERLEQKFEMKRMRLLQDGHPAEEMLLFHGTRAQNVQSIIRNNFDTALSRRQAYGPGIYFSEVPAMSFGYGEALILCRVLTGRVQKGRKVPAQFDPAQYDSYQALEVDGVSGVAYVHVVGDPDQVLPYCVYHFRRKGDQAQQPGTARAADAATYSLSGGVGAPATSSSQSLPPLAQASSSSTTSSSSAILARAAAERQERRRQMWDKKKKYYKLLAAVAALRRNNHVFHAQGAASQKSSPAASTAAANAATAAGSSSGSRSGVGAAVVPASPALTTSALSAKKMGRPDVAGTLARTASVLSSVGRSQGTTAAASAGMGAMAAVAASPAATTATATQTPEARPAATASTSGAGPAVGRVGNKRKNEEDPGESRDPKLRRNTREYYKRCHSSTGHTRQHHTEDR